MSYRLESEIKNLMKIGVDKELAVLVAAHNLEDKTLFNQTLRRMKEENDFIEEQIIKLGFKKSDDIIEDEPIDTISKPTTTDNENKSI